MLNIKKTFLFVLCGFLPISGLYAANIATQYGLIQNVGNYSGSPGWRPDAPYNQTFPRPVYVNGTDLKTDDCQRAVSAVIESYCGAHNGCSGVRLVDVRGDLLTQLARLPGHAFATACAGFVDTMFDEYIANRPLQQAVFPVATGGVSNNTKTTPTFTEPTMPNWQAEYIDRVNELAELQAQNAAGTGVNPDNFPKTFSDLSFEERNAILAQGYEPYKDKSAYTPIEVEDMASFLSRTKNANITGSQNGGAAVTVGAGGNLNAQTLSLADTIVRAMDPDTDEQKRFFIDLVGNFLNASEKNSNIVLDEKFVSGFLDSGNNLEKYKYSLIQLSGKQVVQKHNVNIDWDVVKDKYNSSTLEIVPAYGALICENNRSWQMATDIIGITRGVKWLFEDSMSSSLVDSSETTNFKNACKDLDHNEGCYTVCGDSNVPTDDLNTKVFKPILGKSYCVNPEDYMLYEIKKTGKLGKPIVFDRLQYDLIKSKIKSDVADKGKCDWNEDDIDFYIGYYANDPSIVDVSIENLIVDDVLRIDD